MVKSNENPSSHPDYEAVQQAYKAAFPQIKEAIESLAQVSSHPQFKTHARVSPEFARMAAFDWSSLPAKLTGEFCKDWPIVKQAMGFIQMLQSIPFLSIFAPYIASGLAVVVPLIGVVDGFAAKICGIAPAPTTGGTGGTTPGPRPGG